MLQQTETQAEQIKLPPIKIEPRIELHKTILVEPHRELSDPHHASHQGLWLLSVLGLVVIAAGIVVVAINKRNSN
jgi:hypothetical protein